MTTQFAAKQLLSLAKWKPADGAARVALAPFASDAPSLAFQQAGAPLWFQLSQSNIDWHTLMMYPRDVNLAEAFWDDMQYGVVPTNVFPQCGMSVLTSGTGTVTVTAAVTQDEIGLARFGTGATAVSAAGLTKRFGVDQGQILSQQSFAVSDDRIKLTALSTAAQEYNVFSGWDDGANNRAGLLYDRANHGANWQMMTVNGGVSFFTDTGVPAAAGLQTRLVSIKLPGELGLRCLIQGAVVGGLQTTDFPTARIGRSLLLSSTVGGTTKTADVDWCGGVFDYGGGRSP